MKDETWQTRSEAILHLSAFSLPFLLHERFSTAW